MTSSSTLAYIGLGSNLDNPLGQLESAYSALKKLPYSTLESISNIYQSKPVGPQDQPDYLNAVTCIRTNLKPEQLLNALQAIELEQGRVRDIHWGARTIDLDIILFGNLEVKSTLLTIPHPEMHQRNFVLIPLSDLNPNLILPNEIALSFLLQKTDKTSIYELLTAEAFIKACS